MKCSFSIKPNSIQGDEGMEFIANGFEKPEDVIGKKSIIKIYEIDTLIGKRKETTPNDLLATFETVIIKGPGKNTFGFTEVCRKEIDNDAPTSEYRKDPKGNELPKPLLFTPVQFLLSFHPQKISYTILIKSDNSELEMYIFEIGFTVELEGKLLFDGRKMPAYVNCINLLSDNCKSAAFFFQENHKEMIAARKNGTHFGSQYIYTFPSERAYLEDLSIEVNKRIDEKWIKEHTGLYWEQAGKTAFEQAKVELGLQSTSCIDYVLKAMKLGFEKTGMQNEWKKINSYIIDGKGQYLAKGLSENEWIVLYYNPDIYHPIDDDTEHIVSYERARDHKRYGIDAWPPVVPITDFIINYRPTIITSDKKFTFKPFNTTTTKSLTNAEKLFNIPFGFIIGRGGKHTGMICNGKIMHVHYDRGSDDPKLFDRTDFIREWPWLSGLIVIPKIYWTGKDPK